MATDGLRVRSLPTVGEQSERLEPTLAEGVRVYITDGPAPADGYAWYQAKPYDGDRALPFGWIAAGSRDGEPWIEPFPLGCDTVAPSAEGLVSGEPLEQLYCSVSARNPDITFEGDVWCTFADDHHGPLSGPDWIDQRGYCELRTPVGSRWLYGQPVMRLLDEAKILWKAGTRSRGISTTPAPLTVERAGWMAASHHPRRRSSFRAGRRLS